MTRPSALFRGLVRQKSKGVSRFEASHASQYMFCVVVLDICLAFQRGREGAFDGLFRRKVRVVGFWVLKEVEEE